MRSPQRTCQAKGLQEIIEEIQIKLGIISYQQRGLTAFQQPAELLRRRLLLHPLRCQLFRRNAGEVRDEGRQGPSRREADQAVHALPLLPRLQTDGTQLNDFIPGKVNAGGLRVKDDDPVKPLP